MPSLMQLKTLFQALLRPLVSRLHVAGVTPNQLTLAAALGSVAIGVAVALFVPGYPGVLLCVPAWTVLRLTLNTLDGMLARQGNLGSPLGALLNELGDVVSDAALLLPFARVAGLPAAAVVLIVVLGLIGEFAGVIPLLIGAPRRYDGPLAKPDRAAAFAVIGLLLGCGVPAGEWAALLLYLLIALSVLTTRNRLRAALAAAPPR